MRMSGRRARAIDTTNLELTAERNALLEQIHELTAQRNAARDIIRGLSERNRELLQRPLTRGEQALARQLRYSEDGRAALAEQLALLQAANESYDVPITGPQAVTA